MLASANAQGQGKLIATSGVRSKAAPEVELYPGLFGQLHHERRMGNVGHIKSDKSEGFFSEFNRSIVGSL